MTAVPFAAAFSGGPPPRYAPGGQGFVTEAELERYPALRVPELNSGFAPVWWYAGKVLTELRGGPAGVSASPSPAVRAADMAGRALPVWWKADTGAGRFRVTATLTGGGGEALLFLSRRQLVWRGTLAPGETRAVSALCNVSPIVAVGGGDAALGDLGRAEDVSVDLAVVGAALRAVQIEPWTGPALYLMGDSTVTDQPAQTPYAPGETYAGWGQVLPLYLGERYCVSNHAHSGLSTETFRQRGHYSVLREQIRPGDLVLLQFGHNDQKRLHLAADTGYTENLTRFIRELRALGARPALVTSLARNTWATQRDYNDMLLPFAGAVKRIGAAEAVPVLDLHGAMKAAILGAGMAAAKPWFHPCDYTHLNDFGAHLAAGFVAAEMVRAGLAEPFAVPAWPVRGPLTGLEPPPEEELGGLEPPPGSKPLVDYGLIPGAPWPIT